MINLKKETLEVLSTNGKTINDIVWVGTPEFRIPFDIDKWDFKYDDGYGGEEIPMNLLVVGRDWWLERHEYDGSEWWEYKELPKIPKEIKNLKLERHAGRISTPYSMSRVVFIEKEENK